MNPTVTGIGEIVWDVLPSGARIGGAPLNFAFMADRLGCCGRIISAVGDDLRGLETLGTIAGFGLNTSNIQKNSFPTGEVIVSLNAEGVPEYNIKENSSWDNISLRKEDLELVSSSNAICWGSLAQRSKVSRDTIATLLNAAGESCLKVFDINLRQNFYEKKIIEDSLEICNILKLNEDELPIVADMFCKGSSEPVRILSEEFGISTIIFTQGGKCSKIFKDGECVSHIDTPKVKVADTVGAGDSFTACYLSRILSGESIRKAHEDAVKLSAYICTCPGAINEPKIID